MRKCVFIIFLLLILIRVGVAETKFIDVDSADKLTKAVEVINSDKSGVNDYVIRITKDIETYQPLSFTSKATKTILGNGHTLTLCPKSPSAPPSSAPEVDSFIMIWDGTLNLGKANPTENENLLIIRQATGTTGADSSSCIQVIANILDGEKRNATLNMYDGVTISEWETYNSYGAAVRIFAHQFDDDLKATFNMHGGEINNCRILYDDLPESVQIGGGVAVMKNGEFNMLDGIISGCRVSDNGGGVCLTFTGQRSKKYIN